MRQTRRTFLATLGTAALGAAAGCRAAGGAPVPVRARTRIGLQLYTVRGEMARDVAGTLARVARIGYAEVEFAGYFGRTPREIRELLARNGLTSPSTHVPFEAIRKDWGRTLDDARAIGHRWVTIAWIPEEERRTLDGWKRIAESFNRVGTEARAVGLRFAYHNHDYELKSIDGTVPLDLLLAETDPALVDFEMDLYWLVKAGGDPLDYFARFPKRFPLVHVKDSAGPPEHRMVDVGRGTIDFRRIFARSEQAGIEHYFVEHDQPADAMASARASYEYLEKLLDR